MRHSAVHVYCNNEACQVFSFFYSPTTAILDTSDTHVTCSPRMIIFQSIKNCVSLNGSIFPSTTKQSGLRSGLWEQRDGTTTPMSALASQLDNINCQIIYHQPEESLQLITLNISQLYYGFEIRRLSAHVCVCVLHIYNMLLCVFVHGVTKKAQTNTMDYC